MNLDDSDEFGAFVFRTTGYNSIRTLMARLSYYAAASNNKLSCLPLQLVIRGKSTSQSCRTPIYYVDLTLQDGITLKESIAKAQAINDDLTEHGFNQAALEQSAKAGYTNSQFEIDSEDGLLISQEFYHDVESFDEPRNNSTQAETQLGQLNPKQLEDWQAMEFGLRQSVKPVN